MRVKFLIFVSLLFVSFSSSVNANFSGVDVRSKSDASVCSWFSVVSVSQIWINEAKRRKLTCGGDKRLIPRNSYASGESWRCKSGYTQKGWSCIKKTPTVKVPSNAHKSGNSWVCNTDYYKAGSMCRRVPLNAYSKYNSNFWYCNEGYVKKGGKCQTKITVPKNAHIDKDSWTCDTDYYKVGSMCRRVPANAYSRYYSNEFRCNAGFEKKGGGCVKIVKKINIPVNAHVDGNGWTCNTDYYRNTAGNNCLRVPQNAYSKYDSNYWYCKSGYKRKGSGCEKIIKTKKIPVNAHADGSGWTCNTDYYRNKAKNNCLRVPQNAFSNFDSNNWFCKTGYTKNGNGCKKVVNKPKIPVNAHVDGNGWTCNTDYYRNKAKNNCLRVPQNAYSKYDSNDWYCNNGYKKSGNSCIKKVAASTSEIKGTDLSIKSDTSICSWFEMADPPEIYVREAKKRKLTCNLNSKLIPRNAYATGKTWKCHSGFKESGWSCIKKDINSNTKPANSHFNGDSWICDSDYYKIGSSCFRVPANSYSPFNSNNFYCNAGFKKKNGNICVSETLIPLNAHKFGSGWVCNKNYYRNSTKTGCWAVPNNATSSYSSNDFVCNKGFKKKNGNSCVEDIFIPKNAHKSGSGWVCNKNYYRNSTKTGCWAVPKNATSSYSSNDFVCKNNYYRNSTKTGCLPVPQNATSSGISNNFFCNNGYERKGNSCNKIYNWKLIIGVIVFLLWLITRKKKTKPPKPKKPSKPSGPRSQSTPNIPRRKPRSTNFKDPRSLLIELGVAIAYVDGQFVDDEGYALKKQIQKMINKSGDSEKHKKLFNDTFLRAHNDGKNNKLSFKDICLNLYTKGNKELSLEALKIAYEIMGSDGHIHDKEAEMINYISTQLKISSAIQEDIRDDFFVKTVIKKDFNILNLLGLSVNASQNDKCKALTREFSKWNSRSNMLKNDIHRENAQKILKQIGIARRKNKC